MSDNQAPVHMWTDGACKGNPGPGGWGVHIEWGAHIKDLWGGDEQTTNNQMELLAVVKGLRALTRPCTVVVHVDSRYVMNGIQDWIHNWKRNGWRTAGRKPVKNAELWQELDAEIARHDVSWQWVKGHAGDPGNERADELANRGVTELNR
ncbi:ribonuclease HI [Micrococcales bacterium KH10]|nr:ribonuclease HI [Micrococcales bacterium KH10]